MEYFVPTRDESHKTSKASKSCQEAAAEGDPCRISFQHTDPWHQTQAQSRRPNAEASERSARVTRKGPPRKDPRSHCEEVCTSGPDRLRTGKGPPDRSEGSGRRSRDRSVLSRACQVRGARPSTADGIGHRPHPQHCRAS